MRKAVLTVTDLTERSDAAVVWADTIAKAHDWDLHVGHAIDLAERERGTSEAHLLQLERSIVMADAASRAQMDRTLGSRRLLPTRVIDLDGLVPAMLRRTAQLEPDLVVLSSGWSWSLCGTSEDALSPDVIAQLSANLLVVRHASPPAARRIVVALDPAHLVPEVIQSAARWSYWLREAVRADGLNRVPDLDVVFMDDEGDDRDLTDAITREPADLIVVPAASVTTPDPRPATDRLMRYLLAESVAPLLLLSSPWLPSRYPVVSVGGATRRLTRSSALTGMRNTTRTPAARYSRSA